MRRYKISFIVLGPVLTEATVIGKYGIDSSFARNPDGLPMLAGSHVRGKLRDALEHLAKLAQQAAKAAGTTSPLTDQDIKNWFGPRANIQPMDDGQKHIKNFGEQRGLIYIGDLVADKNGDADGVRARIKIDSKTGVASAGALASWEAPFMSGEQVTFTGTLTVHASSDEADKIAPILRKGLGWMLQVGGRRSIGFGQILDATITPVAVHSPVIWEEAGGMGTYPTHWRLVLAFEDPFCIAKPHRDGNTFESESFVPGRVVKGAIATHLSATLGDGTEGGQDAGRFKGASRFSALSEMFAKIRITDCRPSWWLNPPPQPSVSDIVALKPARPWPLSLVWDRTSEHLHDVALNKGPFLINGESPAFSVDWKSEAFSAAEEKFPQNRPPSELRVRTAVQAKRRAAQPGALFAYELVHTSNHVFVGELDLSGIEEPDQRQRVFNDLRALLCDGLPSISKTNAFAWVHAAAINRETLSVNDMGEEDGRLHFVVTLLSSALLTVMPESTSVSSRSRSAMLREAYEEAFSSLSSNLFKLERFFVDHERLGGSFLANRYLKGKPYQPFLLTKAGSTFVLSTEQGEDIQARCLLAQWLREGLPLPSNVRQSLGFDADDHALWAVCPFIRQNGYGEIAVSDPIHQNLKPTHGVIVLSEGADQ